ncbi:MAG TPA: DUF4190 domain-containing protein [Aeromicrobium sp.]|nr:DUF4190 domain-containing protein [Aeromicrobium sp.]
MSTPEPPLYPGGDNPQDPAANPPGYPPPPPPPPGVPPGMPPGATPQYGMPAPGPMPGSSKATTSLVTGIIGILCCQILGIVAIITGKQATAEAAAAGFPPPSNAKTGVILGWIALALMAVGLVFWALLFALGAAGSFEPANY